MSLAGFTPLKVEGFIFAWRKERSMGNLAWIGVLRETLLLFNTKMTRFVHFISLFALAFLFGLMCMCEIFDFLFSILWSSLHPPAFKFTRNADATWTGFRSVIDEGAVYLPSFKLFKVPMLSELKPEFYKDVESFYLSRLIVCRAGIVY